MNTSHAPEYAPVRVLEVELSRPFEGVPAGLASTGVRYRSAQVLVRLHGHPLGIVTAELAGDVPAVELLALIRAELADRLAVHLADDGVTLPAVLPAAGLPAGCRQRFAVPADPPLVSVAVATCDRAEQLPQCLDGLLANDYPNVEILVVDNSPADGRVRQLLDASYPGQSRIRYLAEPSRGLSRVRNMGLAFARGELVAFADDDTVADPGWIRTLVGEFAADPAAVCVTGLVRPLELETPAQIAFEQHAGFGKGFDRRTYSIDDRPSDSPLFPYELGRYGTGANMALRKPLLADLWGFDVMLGAGSLGRGGEDLDCFIDLLLAGRHIVYTPTAIVYHKHRSDHDALRSQMRDYGVGLSAVLTKRLLTGRGHRLEMLRRLPAGARHVLAADSRKRPAARDEYARDLSLQELAGMAVGPAAYVRSRLRQAWMTA